MLDEAQKIVALIADSITIIVGCIGLWALATKHKKIASYFRLFLNANFNESIKRIEVTLSQIDAIDYDIKERRKEVRGLLGQLAGQIQPLIVRYGVLKPIYDELSEILEHKTKVTFSESSKRRLTHNLRGILNNLTVEGLISIAEVPDGQKDA